MDSATSIGQIALHLVTRPEPVETNKIAVASDVVHPNEHNSTLRSLASPLTQHLREGLDERAIF